MWLVTLASLAALRASPLKLWYSSTASTPLAQGLMLGNGRMGGIVMGNPTADTVYLNDSSLWTGDANPSGAYSGGFGAYQYLGTLALNLPGQTSFTNLRRELDIGDSLATVSYTSGGVAYTREYLASNPDQAMIIRLTASGAAAHTGTLVYADSHSGNVTGAGNSVIVSGALSNGIKYGAKILVLNTGGSVTAAGGTISFTGCDSLTVVIAMGTNYVMDSAQNWQGPDPAAGIAAQAANAAAKSYATIKVAHQDDFHALFNRVALDVGTTTAAISALPTDQRVAQAAAGADPEMEQLLYQYGRYLLISCSRPGGLPANLQGLWASEPATSTNWLSDYHTNINVEMNYWGAEVSNLSECHKPLLDLIESQIPVWRQRTSSLSSADIPNGVPRGWTVRTSHNITGGMGWNWNKPGNAWYALHFWEHYAFTGDRGFLQNTAYPVLKEVCQFWEDTLVTLADGSLGVPNGWSPEHGPTQNGVSYDQEIVWNLFNNYIKASETLGVDAVYRATITGLRDRLHKPGVGSWGQLLEWYQELSDATLDTVNDRHRHTSHLFAVYPGSEINYAATSKLMDAAKVSLIARGETGDSQRGWVWAWRCALYARLREGDAARRMITNFFAYNTLPNLISNHPPPQWDGNFGLAGAIPEMLVQSHAGLLELLPALPSAWPRGSVSGLRARGGFIVALNWSSGALTTARVQSTTGGAVRVAKPWSSYALKVVAQTAGSSVTTAVTNGIISFDTTAGETYLFSRGDVIDVPSTPSGLTAAAGNTRTALSWSAALGAAAYTIQRSTDGVNFTAIGTAIGTSYVDTGLTNGTTYTYKISATNVMGSSTDSGALSVAPTSQTAISISINFKGGSTNYGTPAAMVSTESAGYIPATNWNTVTGASGTATSLGLSTGGSSSASVTWSSANVWSTAVTDTAGNNRLMKGYLDTSATSTTTVTVSGLPSSYTSGGYAVYVYADGQNGSSNKTGKYTLSGTTINLTDAASTDFSGAFVLANNGTGNCLVFSSQIASAFTLTATGNSADSGPRAPVNGLQIVGQTIASAPAAPTGLSGSVVSDTSVQLTWTDAATDESAYLVEYSLAGANAWVACPMLAANSSSYLVSGLSAGTGYDFRVKAMSLGGVVTSAALTKTTFTAVENWRVIHFGTTNNSGNAADSADPDGDGWTNAQEFASGTDPNDRTSLLRINNLQRSGGDIVLSFPTVLGKIYRVEASDTLLAGSWVTVQENIAGTGGSIQVTSIGGASQPEWFYRIIVQ